MPTKTLENSSSRLLISEILRKVSNAKTKAEKIKILRENNSVALRQLMIINFDERPTLFFSSLKILNLVK